MKTKFFNFSKEFLKSRNLVLGSFHLPYNPNLLDKAKYLRRHMTKAEKKLWFEFLRDHKYHFYRQRVIDNYIVDFFCARVGLVIEIDGPIHNDEDVKENDEIRSLFLKDYNLDIVRFLNEDVLYRFENVCQDIDKKIDELEKKFNELEK